MNELLAILPNRPDVLGYGPRSDSPRSKYIKALERVVASLKARAAPIDPKDVRGKRRKDPDRNFLSNTLRTYLKSLEIFSFWMQGRYGRELDPKEVTRTVTFEFMEWMFTSDEPNVNILRARAAGGTVSTVFQAAERAIGASLTGEVGIQNIYEHLPPTYAHKGSTYQENIKHLHTLLGEIVRLYHAIVRLPTIRKLRVETGTFYSRQERDPLIYRYSLEPRKKYKASTACTHISVLSTIWQAMTEGENTDGGEAPLQYNPWKGPRGPFALALARMKEEKRRRKDKVIPNPVVDALIEATVGTDFEARRNRAAILLLIYTGMRAEELVGALRKDLVNVDGVLALRIFGKGDKFRTVPIYSEVRDALAQLDAKLEEMSQIQSEDPEARWTAAYATTLLQSKEAPILPALPRWGANDRDADPVKAAIEPLDTSGLRAILNKLQQNARVYDKRLQIVRPLNQEEAGFVHPHALRHYAATAAQEAGLRMEEVQQMLGHEDLRTTQTYVHIAPRSMTQFGAYVAQARTGAVMSPEEATKLRSTKRSALVAPDIVAAPAFRPGRRSMPARPKPTPQTEEPERPRTERPSDTSIPPSGANLTIESPLFAYQLGAEVLEQYLPQGYEPNALPKGGGAWATLRIGRLSKLPWWAGRSNTWKFSQMAPIVSYFQMFNVELRPTESLRPPLEQMWRKVLDEEGVTAASAFAEWVAEVLGYASAMFFDAMRSRVDADGDPEEWIDFDAPATPSEGVVRMHPVGKIVEWFEKHATAAKASIVRKPPSWVRWQHPFEIADVVLLPEAGQEDRRVFRTVIRVEKLPGFDEMFKPKAAEGMDVDVYKAGTGKGSKRVRYRGLRRRWDHGIVTKRETDPSDPGKALITIEGDPIPDSADRLESSWDGGKTETVKRSRDEFYPMLADLVKLPSWFFSQDPIAELPETERAELQDWLDKIQGRKLSRVRITSSASELWNLMLGWKDASRQAAMPAQDFEEEARRRQAVIDYEEAIRKASRDLFSVEVDPRIVVGRRGETWVREAKKKNPQAFQMMAPQIDDETLRKLKVTEATLNDLVAWAKKLPAGERRIFAYVQMKLGFNIPITEWGLSRALIEATDSDLFASANLNWQNGTIVHSEEFKRRFFVSYGTDSECVVRRMLRNLWERKKLHEFEYLSKTAGPAKPMHRDVLHRVVNAWMAYLVPCPAKMEEHLRLLLEKVGRPVQFRNMDEVFDEEMLGQIKDQPAQLQRWWTAFKGEEEAETELSRQIAILEQMPERYERGAPEMAKPNLDRAKRVVPNLVSLVFVEYTPV